MTYAGKRYECLNSSKCQDATTAGLQYWPGTGSNWQEAWEEFDDCIEVSIPTTPDVGAPRGECPITVETGSAAVLSFKKEPCQDSEDCQVNSRCTEVDTATSCGGHSKCSSGAALACVGEDACVEAICQEDSICCASFWDATDCADRVEEICGVECGAVSPSLCPHDACVIGEALEEVCSDDVEEVCDTLPDCCSGTAANSWDQGCVDEFTEIATGIPLSGGVPGAGQSLCDFAVVSGSSDALNLNTSPINGGLHSTGNMAGGRITGNASTEGSFSNTTATGSSTAGLAAPPYQEPTWAQIVPGGNCPGLPGGNSTWPAGWSAGAPGPGNYGTVSSLKSFRFPNGGGDYYVRSLQFKNNHVINMPADGSNVNIYVCNSSFTASVRGVITGGAGQLNVWVKTGNITLNNGGSKWNKTSYTGVFTTVDGSIFAKAGAQVNGMLRSINGKVSVASDGFVNASALIGSVGSVKRQSCFDRGIDPNLSAPPICPIGDSPAQSESISESGLCINNLAEMGGLTSRPAGECSETDLALDVPCEDKMPVCNRGDSPLSAGQAEIVFFPRQTLQFATDTPDLLYQSSSTCNVDQAIPAGECVTITCPVFTEDMTARVKMKSSATQTECNDLDNWSYYPFDRACGGGSSGVVGLEKVVEEIYQATCPDDSTVAWGFLGWNSALAGAATIDFEARTSSSATFSGPKILLETASSADVTEDCPYLTSCTVDVGTSLYPDGESDQPAYLELTMTLKPDGEDLATLEDWDLTYTCIVDQ